MLSVLSIPFHQNEKVTRIASRHPREDFPPHPDDPAFREIACIMAYFQSERNSPSATARLSRRTDGSHITNRRAVSLVPDHLPPRNLVIRETVLPIRNSEDIHMRRLYQITASGRISVLPLRPRRSGPREGGERTRRPAECRCGRSRVRKGRGPCPRRTRRSGRSACRRPCRSGG